LARPERSDGIYQSAFANSTQTARYIELDTMLYAIEIYNYPGREKDRKK